MVSIVNKIRSAMKAKLLTIPEAYGLLDPGNVGLVSFSAFCTNIDNITQLS